MGRGHLQVLQLPSRGQDLALRRPQGRLSDVREGTLSRHQGSAVPQGLSHVASNDVLKALGARVPKSVVRVGLFVDPDDALLDERLATGAIDLLQLQGSETPERIAAIKARTGKPVMKVIKVAQASHVERDIAAYAAVADRLMFDAAEGTLPGGNARVFDWTILSGRSVPLPWFLAGGLTPGN